LNENHESTYLRARHAGKSSIFGIRLATKQRDGLVFIKPIYSRVYCIPNPLEIEIKIEVERRDRVSFMGFTELLQHV